MGSALLSNDRVTFVACRNFSSRGKDYAVGDDFPQEDTDKIEVFVRARYVIPVVEDLADRPKYWYKEVRLKSDVLERLLGDRTQLMMPEGQEPDSEDVVALEVLTHPELTPEPEGEGGDVFEPEEPATEDGEEVGGDTEPAADLFDPGEYTVVEVLDYLNEHPDDEERVLAAEAAGKARKGILEA